MVSVDVKHHVYLLLKSTHFRLLHSPASPPRSLFFSDAIVTIRITRGCVSRSSFWRQRRANSDRSPSALHGIASPLSQTGWHSVSLLCLCTAIATCDIGRPASVILLRVLLSAQPRPEGSQVEFMDCPYKNQVYKYRDHFMADDGCNTCYCIMPGNYASFPACTSTPCDFVG